MQCYHENDKGDRKRAAIFHQPLLKNWMKGVKTVSTCERVSLLDAARELGMNPQGLREYMKRGLIDIGLVLPNSKGTGFRYIIMREKLNRILGKEREGVFYGSEKDRQAL
nr:MAG TPA: helix-turn-helix domain protein [Caudoviricetes sp.]